MYSRPASFARGCPSQQVNKPSLIVDYFLFFVARKLQASFENVGVQWIGQAT